MSNTQLRFELWFFLFCLLLIQAGRSCFAAGNDKTFQITTSPQGASVYHYLRGNKYFLGVTPIKVRKSDLAGKESTRILLRKFGYKQELFNVDVDGNNKSFSLKRESQPYVQSGTSARGNPLRCKRKVEKTIEKLISMETGDLAALQLPIRWVEKGNKAKIALMAEISNHSDVSAVKKMARRDKDKAVDLVEKLLEPMTQYLLSQFGKVECLNTMLLIGVYQDKGLNIDLTPYRDYWIGESEYTIVNTRYKIVAVGSTIELKKDMVVSRKTKSFLFEYKLH